MPVSLPLLISELSSEKPHVYFSIPCHSCNKEPDYNQRPRDGECLKITAIHSSTTGPLFNELISIFQAEVRPR